MEQLKALEQKVLSLVAAHKALCEEAQGLRTQNAELTAKVESLESSLMSESSNSAELSDERQSICSTIDGLLKNISSIELGQQSES